MDRLQKLIAEAGICSRRKAEELIKEGRVKVNGEIVTELGYKASFKDNISVDDKILSKEEKKYFLLNKPRGVVTTVSDDKNRKTVIDLMDTDVRIYPVGRLDYDTTGALLLTNDGEFANIIMSPNKEIPKVYLAKIDGILTKDNVNNLLKGVVIDKVKVKAKHVKIKKYNKESNTSMIELTINDGRNHQVKKMFKEVGHEVLKLTRKKIGIFDVEKLKSGQYRKLTPKEVQIIYQYKKYLSKD